MQKVSYDDDDDGDGDDGGAQGWPVHSVRHLSQERVRSAKTPPSAYGKKSPKKKVSKIKVKKEKLDILVEAWPCSFVPIPQYEEGRLSTCVNSHLSASHFAQMIHTRRAKTMASRIAANSANRKASI